MASAVTRIGPIPYESILSAVCRINFRSNTDSGFLCVSKRGFTGEEDTYLLVTNNRVISDISMRSLKTYFFEFLSVPNLKQFQFAEENIEAAWRDQKVDATVIEIKKEMAARMMQQGARFLEIGAPVVGTNAAVVGFQEGILKSINYGEIRAFMNGCKILYRSSMKPLHCGSPLVTMEGIAVGIHKGIFSNELNEAVNIEFVLQLYFQQKKLPVKSSNQGRC